jgi:hypothetical protein
MPRTRKPREPEAPAAPIPAELLAQFVSEGPLTQEGLESAVRRFKKALIERALGAELTHHLGYPPGGTKPEASTNHRNGTSDKTVLTDDGPVPIELVHLYEVRDALKTHYGDARAAQQALAIPAGEWDRLGGNVGDQVSKSLSKTLSRLVVGVP